jgi:rhodanese-related sulfurtransferase
MMAQKLFALSLVIWLAAALGCSDSMPPDSPTGLLARAKSEVASGKAVLLDVREESEWQGTHLADAQLVPSSLLRDASKRASALKDLDPNRTIYTHCQRGGRAKACADILRQAGFTVVPLQVDYESLIDAGFKKAS